MAPNFPSWEPNRRLLCFYFFELFTRINPELLHLALNFKKVWGHFAINFYAIFQTLVKEALAVCCQWKQASLILIKLFFSSHFWATVPSWSGLSRYPSEAAYLDGLPGAAQQAMSLSLISVYCWRCSRLATRLVQCGSTTETELENWVGGAACLVLVSLAWRCDVSTMRWLCDVWCRLMDGDTTGPDLAEAMQL